MSLTQRERLIRRIARSIVWHQAEEYRRDAARRLAMSIVDELRHGPAEGKAIERALPTILPREEQAG